MKETFVNSQKLTTKKWYVIDAEDQILGRLATKASTVLMGKNKNTYTPFLENGDYVIIINAEKIKTTGKKDKQKLYRNHSGYPGGMRVEKFSSLIERRPEKIIEQSIKGMLPKGPLGRQIYRNLKVYKGAEHPHTAQSPELIMN
jgi:large subunit ribosomal protein L13|tara:strand:- start:4365 stop:4796 length:432 start_codon:yes stop_codon:yes gene_type:complete